MEELEKFFGIYFFSLLREGKRFMQAKTMAAALQVIQATRKMAVNVFFGLLGLLLIGSGIFALILQLLNQYNFLGRVFWDPAILLSLGTLVVGVLMCAWTFQESRWLDAIHFDSVLDELEARRAIKTSVPTSKAEEGVNRDDLRAAIDALISERLEQGKAKVQPEPSKRENLSA